jgi:site-specific DNA recombinase
MSKRTRTLFGNKPTIKDYESALSYCRVSSKKQELEGSGLSSQETRNEQLAIQHNLKIEKVFKDTFSGGGDFMNRPAMRELLAYIDAHPHKKYAVIFDDLKRFARDTKFHFELRSALAAREVFPLCANYVFDDTAEGTFIETIQAAHNQLEREQNRRQVIEKQRACLERGYWAFHPLYGYKKVKTALGKKDVPNEKNQFMKELFEGYFSGRFHQLIDGARFLKEAGVFGKSRPEKYISVVKSILTQPFYAGFIEFPRWEVTRRIGIHDATVSSALFEAVQKKINRPATIGKLRQDINPDFPLRGLVNCSCCSKKLTAAWSKGKRRFHPYYFCQNVDCPLKRLSIRKNDIEEKFNTVLQSITAEEGVLKLAKAVFTDAWETEEKNHSINLLLNDRRKKECGLEIEKFTNLAGKATSPMVVEQYEKHIEKLAQEIKSLESDESASHDYSSSYRTALDKVLGILKSPYSYWTNLDLLEQQRFFYFLFEENLSYDREKGYRTPKNTVVIRLIQQIAAVGTDNVEMGGIEPPCI